MLAGMETVADNKNYELAYHLTADLEEGAVPAQVVGLEKLVVHSGGTVLLSREPKRKHLSYPIRQKHYAYFGILDFNARPEVIAQLNTQLKLQNQFLRYLVIAKPPSDKELRVLGSERPRPRMKTHEPSAQPTVPAVKPEQMEKEIAEVLEKI